MSNSTTLSARQTESPALASLRRRGWQATAIRARFPEHHPASAGGGVGDGRGAERGRRALLPHNVSALAPTVRTAHLQARRLIWSSLPSGPAWTFICLEQNGAPVASGVRAAAFPDTQQLLQISAPPPPNTLQPGKILRMPDLTGTGACLIRQ